MSVTIRRRYIGDNSIPKKKRPYKFQLNIYREGKRRREVIKDIVIYPDEPIEYKKEKLRIVENIRSSYQINLNTLRYGFSSSLKKKENFIEYYEKIMATKTESNQSGWRNCLIYIKKFEGDFFSFEFITAEWINELVSYMSSHVSLQSCYTYLSKLKCCLNQAVKDQIIQDNPCIRMDPIRFQRKEMTFLTEEEIKILIDTPSRSPKTKAAFLFCCFTGLRQSDIRNLRWKDIKDDKIHFTQKKTKKVEVMPLSENAKLFLGPKGKDNAVIFPISSHSSSLNRSIRNWVRRSSLTKEICYHCSRHTFATLLITYGVNLYTVSKLLGHSDIKSTMVYAKVIDKEKEKAILSLPSFKLRNP